VCLGKKIPIPPKGKVKAWEALRQQFCPANIHANWEAWKRWRLIELGHRIHVYYPYNPKQANARRAEKHKLESQLHHTRLLQPDALSQNWPRIHRQIQRYRNSTRPLLALDWSRTEAEAWLKKQPESLFMVFEQDRLVCRVHAKDILPLLTRETPLFGETPTPDFTLADPIIFPPHFNCALFAHPEGRFTFCQTAGKS
jgi:hypothetical protein